MGLREVTFELAKGLVSILAPKQLHGPRVIDPRTLTATIEVFSQPGHGKTSYLWALLFMLRKLSLVWPDYLCWSQDEPTTLALRAVQEALIAGRLPAPAGDAARYSLALQRLDRWGRRPLIVWDRRDPVFSPGEADASSGEAPAWGAPALWLISLPDLDATEEQLIDLRFEELMRARMAAGRSSGRDPLKLIVALTKADAIADLPAALRRYLKEDRLGESQGAASPAAVAPTSIPESLSAQHYLATLWRVDAEIRTWLQQRAAGQMLLRRAAEYHVDPRFAIVSAIGSGIAGGKSNLLSWSPRRVLDPLFWALELDTPRAS